MASEIVKLFGAVEMEYAASAAGTLRALSDLPGNAMAQRASLTVPLASTRRQIRFRLPGVMKGHMLQLSWNPGAAAAQLYRVRVWARELPRGAWNWYPVYVPETPEEWAAFPLPIPPTAEEWSAFPLPIPPTPEQWSAFPLPIPPTPEEWAGYRLPIKETPLVPSWVRVEVDR